MVPPHERSATVGPDLILSIDIGNTVVKAVLYDLQGRWIARHGVDCATLKPTPCMVAAFGTGRFARMDNSATSAANLGWYVRSLIGRDGHRGDPFEPVNRLGEGAAMAPDDPMFHPYLCGGRNGAQQRGGSSGLAGWHDEGHMLRALYEGVGLEHRRHVGVLTASGAGIGQVTLSGGGTRSPHRPQTLADIPGLPVNLGSADETGAPGAAMAAAVGTGHHPSLKTAAAVRTRPRAKHFPDTRRQRLTVAMEPFGADLAAVGRS